MADRGKVLLGLAIFVALATFPAWFRLLGGESGERPELELPAGSCVESREFMAAHHPELLQEWRDEVVREGRRANISVDGREVRKSLTGGCLDCHESRERFCNRCHEYAGVEPNCWDCHVDPAEATR